MLSRITMGCVLILVYLGAAATFASDRTVVSELREHIRGSESYSEDEKKLAVERLESSSADGSRSSEIIGSVLARLHKDLAAGVSSYRDGEIDSAIDALEPLAGSDDPYVAAEARFYLANCFVAKADYESALPWIAKRNPHSIHQDAALFLRAVCHSKLLNRQEAIDGFAEFMRAHPNAAERQRVTAWRQLEILSMVQDGSLDDVYQKMEYSRRRLSLAKADEPTQARQIETISILDKLIELAEEREAIAEAEESAESPGGRRKAPSQGSGAGKEGPGSGIDDKTPMKTVRQVQQGTNRSPWDHLRDKRRDAKALAAIKEKYPARYRALIEQYYRSLQDENER